MSCRQLFRFILAGCSLGMRLCVHVYSFDLNQEIFTRIPLYDQQPVDVVFVLDHERLFHDLQRELPRTTQVVPLPKSGGVSQCRFSNFTNCILSCT